MSTIIYQSGQLNLAGAMAPGLYVEGVAAPPVMRGVATNGYGMVGVASWGPVNAPFGVGSPQAAQASLGPVTVRPHDLATAVAVAFGLGQYNNSCIRVTDGTDTAATAQLKDGATITGATLTGFYTGSLGNTLTAVMSAGTKPTTYKCQVSLPGAISETYDNLAVGVVPGAVTPGTGYTSVPLVAISAPQTAGGVQATATASLVALSATIGAGGAGYAINDKVTFPNGVVFTVSAVTGGAVTAVTVSNAGSITAGPIPANPVAMISTTGAGTGLTLDIVYGLGPLNITKSGSGYTAATATISGGGAGTGGAYALGAGCWVNLVSAINNGQSGVRGPSQIVVATLGTSASIPALQSYAFSGGSDGAAGVTDADLVGTNTYPPTGMYALQNASVLTGNLVDHQTPSQWSTIAAFGQEFGIFMPGQDAPGASVSTTAADLSTAGVDTYAFKSLTGDWVYWNDTTNKQQRLLGPATFWAPMRAQLNPNDSTLNKPVNGLIGTMSSEMSLTYTNQQLLAASQGRVDYLANPSAGGNYFGFQTDMNSSSDASTNSEAYTTMTNFLALSLAANFGWVVGNPQTADLRTEVNDSITSWLSALWLIQKFIGDPNNQSAVPFSVQTNAANNPSSQVDLGIMQTLVKVTYQSIVRVFAISLMGGSTVSVSVSNG